MKIPMMVLAAGLAIQPLSAQLQLSALDGLAAKAKESVEITLDANTLQMVNGLRTGSKGKDDNEAAAKVLANLKGITVRSYEFGRPGQYDPAVLRTLREQLQGQGWTKFVDVKDGGESFELYSRNQGGKNTGFAMVAAEPAELAFIYIDGPLELTDLASLGGQFGIPKNIPMLNQSNSKDKKGKE